MPPTTPGESKRGRGGRGKGGGKGRGEGIGRSRSPPGEQQLETSGGRTEAEVHESGDDTDVASVASASQKNKKMKVVADLSQEEEQTMVEWLEANPIFYNKKMTSYKETAKKERMWMEKAAEMGKPFTVLKTWYTSLRSRFGRLKKKRSGNEYAEMTERDEWIVTHFDFLRPHVHEVQKRTTMKPKLGATCAVAEDVDDNPDQPRISEPEEAILTGLEERSLQIIALQQQILDGLRPRADRERDAFVDWMRSVIHELDHSLWRRCQQEISNTLYRYIGENDQLKREQAPAAPTPSTSTQPLQSSSQACSAILWQPPSSQWPTVPASSDSVWESQDVTWVAQQLPHHFHQQQQRTQTQLQPMRPASAGPTLSTVSMMAREGMSSAPMAASPSSNTQGDNSQISQSSFYLSQFIKKEPLGS